MERCGLAPRFDWDRMIDDPYMGPEFAAKLFLHGTMIAMSMVIFGAKLIMFYLVTYKVLRVINQLCFIV